MCSTLCGDLRVGRLYRSMWLLSMLLPTVLCMLMMLGSFVLALCSRFSVACPLLLSALFVWLLS